jgi:hypothetical protein
MVVTFPAHRDRANRARPAAAGIALPRPRKLGPGLNRRAAIVRVHAWPVPIHRLLRRPGQSFPTDLGDSDLPVIGVAPDSVQRYRHSAAQQRKKKSIFDLNSYVLFDYRNFKGNLEDSYYRIPCIYDNFDMHSIYIKISYVFPVVQPNDACN